VHLDNGWLLDSTGHCGPIAVMIGAGQLFPALEDRIAGMRAGETRSLRVPPEDVLSVARNLVRDMPRDRLPPDLELTVGEEYRLKARRKAAALPSARDQGRHRPRGFQPPNAGQARRDGDGDCGAGADSRGGARGRV
jgi:hypothetical protein